MRFLHFLAHISMIPLCLFAYSEQEIARELKFASISYNIDKRILYTIAKNESGFNPFVIAFVDSNSNYKFDGITTKVSKYKDKYFIRLYGDRKSLENASRILKSKNKRFDAGIMQISSANFTYDEIDRIFSLSYNIKKGTDILKACADLKRNLKNTIECYNRGTGKTSSYPYYSRFVKSFIRDFGNVLIRM